MEKQTAPTSVFAESNMSINFNKNDNDFEKKNESLNKKILRDKYKDLINLWRKEEEEADETVEGSNFIYYNGPNLGPIQDEATNLRMDKFNGMKKRLNMIEKDFDDEYGYINQEITKAFISTNIKNKELATMNKDLIEQCTKLREITDLKKIIKDLEINISKMS